MTEHHRKAEQIPLDLSSLPAMARADFLQAPSNAVALAAVERPDGLPAGIMVLTGPEGSGKTHLAQVWAAQTGARWQSPLTLAQDLPQLLARRDAPHPTPPLCIALDDAALIHGPEGEEALFHLVNHLRGTGQLLLTARRPVRDWGLALPDLISRLTAAAHVALAEPDEALLGAVLVKLFNDRQLRVQPALITYLLSRMERSLAAAGDLVARLDARALELGRPVTRSLAQDLMAEDLDNPPPGGA